MISLFEDQQRLIDKSRAAIGKNKFVLVQAATGAGKTVIGASMIHGSRAKGTRSMFVVPRKTLLRQTAKTFMQYSIPFTYFAAGYSFDPYAQVILASAQTLTSRMDKLPDVDVIFFDECHYGGATLDKIIRYYKDRGKYGVGLSATPTKLDGKGMGDWYDAMVEGEAIRWLIDNNRLSDYKMYAPNIPDLSGVKSSGGDYAASVLNEKMEKDTVIIGDAVKYYKSHAMGRLGLTFCTSRNHNEITAKAYRDQGISAVAVDGNTPQEELSAAIKAFARREIFQLVNCDLLTFGFDLASAAGMPVTVETMHDLQPTQSLAKQMQKNGRVLRYEVGKTALIFDHAGNWQRHGLPDDEREWTLEGKEKRGGAQERAVSVKQCPQCYYAHPPSAACPSCGFVYETKGRDVENIEGELKQLTREDMERIKLERIDKRKRENRAAKTYDELVALGVSRGYKFPAGWATQILNLRSR